MREKQKNNGRLLFTGNVPRGVFVNKVHRKPENLGTESCGCMIPVQREVVAVRGANSSTVTCTVRITIK